jgi:hypothetical protein
MDSNFIRTRFRSEIQAFVRLYHAMEGTAIGLASVTLDGLDQSWRDRVQRIRALPREAPRRKHMIEALIKLVEQTLWKQQENLQKLQQFDATLATEALNIAKRGAVADEPAQQDA